MVTRRDFLGAGMLGMLVSAQSAFAQRGLEQFTVPTPPCKDDALTPAARAATGYRPNAPARTSLIEPRMAGAAMVLSGYVTGIRCGRVKGARVDVWQPDANGVLDAAGFRLRGHQLTDAEGRYRFETVVPGTRDGRAPWIGVRVAPPSGPALLTTLFFPDRPGNAADPSFAPALVMKPGPRGWTFDFVLDL